MGLVQTGVYVRESWCWWVWFRLVLCERVLVGLVQTGVYVRELVGLVQTGVYVRESWCWWVWFRLVFMRERAVCWCVFGSDWCLCERVVWGFGSDWCLCESAGGFGSDWCLCERVLVWWVWFRLVFM